MITLAIITGNSERYIERFLRAFAPLASEIVIVRAIGNQEPDGTLPRAAKLCRQLGKKLILADYLNTGNDGTPAVANPSTASPKDWPHVDDFAAARSLAFSLASNDWVFWADTDDTITLDSVVLIREAFRRHHKNFDGFAVEYHVPEDGLRVQKERLVNRNAGGWRYAIHEEFKFHAEQPRVIRVAEALVTHSPSGSRKPNDERNLRILRSMDRATMTLGHRFHLVQSLRACGEPEASITEATALLSEKELGTEERYELLMNLGELCPDKANQGNLYLQALGVNPNRREAYGELALWSVITGRFSHALAFAAAMMAIPEPTGYLWNARRMYYGWFGVKLYAMALRVNDQAARAHAVQYNHFHAHGAKISLLHATRGRGRQAYKMQHEWLTRAADPDAIEHIFAIDADDLESRAFAFQQSVILDGQGGCVAAWNAAAACSSGQILVQMSDDFLPPLHWDQLILERIGDPSEPAVLAVSDGFRTDPLLCMAIMTRTRWQQQGYMFHPDFMASAMYSDNYFTDRAYADSVVIEARDLVFEHHHPAAGKAAVDETYARQNAEEKYRMGKTIYVRLTNGPSSYEDLPGWFNYEDLYDFIAEQCHDGDIIVEIGCWKGRSINYLASRCKALGKKPRLHVVDTFRGEEAQPDHAGCGYFRAEFERNLQACGNADMVTIIEGDSAASASHFTDGSVFAVFVDAAHEYEPVCADLRAWMPKVKPNGILAGHDYQHEPVHRAVSEHIPIALPTSATCWIDSSRLHPSANASDQATAE